MKKRFLCSILAAVMMLASVPAAFAAEGSLSNFEKKYTYNEGRFEDVSSDDWFESGVSTAYEYGMVVGVSETRYAPKKNITIAQTITMACRLNSIYYGNEIRTDTVSGQAWYEPYLEYAMAHGIVYKGDYTDYTCAASRQQFAYLIAKALPGEALPVINMIIADSIPDLKSSNYYGPSVYMLYKAGIITGVDEEHTFAPLKLITRAEAATIISRMSDTSLRIKIRRSGLQGSAFKGMTNAEVVKTVGPIFTADQEMSGVLASVSMAQFILESGYGKSSLSVEANNCFGMKTSLSGNTWEGSFWDGVSVSTKVTKEQDEDGIEFAITADFRKYDCVEDSIMDHSAYLLGAKNGSKLRYEGLKGCTDYRTAAQIIKDGGYATSTTYVDDLCSIIERWDLTKYEA